MKDYQKNTLLKTKLLFCLILGAFFSCQEEKEDTTYFYLEDNPSTVTLLQSGGVHTYPVYSNGHWKIELSSQENWITIEPLEGHGNGAIVVIAEENDSPLERSVDLTFNVAGMEYNKTLQIKQTGEELFFDIEGNPTELEAGTAGTVQSYTIHSNGTWRIELEEDVDWVNINPSEGTNDGTFTVTIPENTDSNARLVNLAFYLNGQPLSTVFVIYQEGLVGLVDIDGNEYETVMIGGRRWMKENLKVTRYRSGDLIPTGLDNTAWSDATSGAYAVAPHAGVAGIESEAEMIAEYGLLYNWYAVEDVRGLCPEGWRVPSDTDWQELEIAVGMSSSDAGGSGWRGSPAGINLKGVEGGWLAGGKPGTDAFGFSVYPVAARLPAGSYETRVGQFAFFWTSSIGSSEGTAVRRAFGYNYESVGRTGVAMNHGYSIRCVRVP